VGKTLIFVLRKNSFTIKKITMQILNTKVLATGVLLMFLSLNAFCQTDSWNMKSARNKAKMDKTKVPKAVTESFIVDYPATDYNYWYGYPTFDYSNNWYDYDPYFYDSDNPNNYVVEFTTNNTPYRAVYTSAGKKVAVHKTVSMVPAAITAAVANGMYKTWTVAKEQEEIYKDTDKDQLKVYKVSVTRGTERHALFFSRDGKLLKDTKVS